MVGSGKERQVVLQDDVWYHKDKKGKIAGKPRYNNCVKKETRFNSNWRDELGFEGIGFIKKD